MFIVFILAIICLIVIAYLTGTTVEASNYERDLPGIPIQLGEVTVERLILNPMFEKKNRHGQIEEFYKSQLHRTKAQALQTAEIEERFDNLATLNLHFFSPINLAHTNKEVMEAPLRFMKRFNISVLVLQEVPIDKLAGFAQYVKQLGLYHTANEFDYGFADSREPITNMVISRYPITIEKKLILPSESLYRFRHRHAIFFRIPQHPLWPMKLFATTHLEVAEKTAERSEKQRIRKEQLRAIMDEKPDFILGDLNFAEETPEYKMIAKKYQTTKAVDINGATYTTTPFDLTVDYIWYRKPDPTATWQIKTYSVNYPWSDHRPVIGIYEDHPRKK